MSHPQRPGLPEERTKFHGFWIVESAATGAAALRHQRLSAVRILGGFAPLRLFLLKNQLSILRADFDFITRLELAFEQAHRKLIEHVFLRDALDFE